MPLLIGLNLSRASGLTLAPRLIKPWYTFTGRMIVPIVFLDTSGETLAKHSYRKIPGKAPMLEALAVSTIMATNWDRKSTFINPMCGSGTLAIEAALLATDKVSGFIKNELWLYAYYAGYDETVFFAERRKYKR